MPASRLRVAPVGQASSPTLPTASTPTSNFSFRSLPEFVNQLQPSPLAQQLLYSRAHSVVYILLIALNSFLFTWSLGKYHVKFQDHQRDDDAWYIILDTIATMLLLYEVMIRILANPQTFFASILSIVDLFLCLLCVITLILHNAFGLATVGAAALFVRYTLLFGRLIIQQVRQRAVSASERHTIDFNRLETVSVDRFSTNESMTLDVKSSPMESNFNKNMEPSVLLSHMNPTISNRMSSNVPLETRSPLLRHQGVGMHHVDDCVEL